MDLARIIFMGTSEFACLALEALAETNYLPELVVTKTDTFSGRRRQWSPVKKWAVSRELPFWQPQRINCRESIERLIKAAPDLFVVVAYGAILSKEVLAIPTLGAINVHASILPDLRGAAPVEWAIMLGYTETGVTTMFMDEGLDTGDIILQQATRIGATENSGQLRERLGRITQELLPKTIELVLQGKAPRQRQVTDCPRYAPALDSAIERLDWELPASVLVNKVRALAPTPGAFCRFRGKRLKVYAAQAHSGFAQPGLVVLQDKKFMVGTASGLLELISIKLEGKGMVTARDFLNGYRIQEGELLE